MKKYIHAIPNFSEGKDPEIIRKIVSSFSDREGIKLIDFYPDPDFGRTVVEVIGEPEPLAEALLDMTRQSVELIDMNEYEGKHPHIGAQDTIPVFPLHNISLEECVEFIDKLGNRIYEELSLPVYFSGDNARNDARKSLDFIRKGNYKGLKEVVGQDDRKPDIGEGKLHPTAGAVICSAGTNPLVAFNVILDTDDIELARKIAKAVRGPSGGFSTVRSVGLLFTDRNQVCVSMNMFDYAQTPLYRTYELVKLEASRVGVQVVGTELVGTLKQETLIMVAEFYLQLENFNSNQITENHLIGL